ncbi:hypothetical protein AMAG_05376 [Allomyces macrogynus ATCC 38327]|uniref:Sulfhydryl oxidase n=1 Tax=Allomyces macrogynus (strain ATCC 38327) TaxID=578462 RepID=A0A0L0SBV9_ALLM3|nr:hypothetical protein AMAG_05376 [Allomyces macrogynus ATCC 38327]|eukprot:KNE59927.1 hypothetical protein AMAG_05376 [Allomyces macrogynus ATCC 38327]
MNTTRRLLVLLGLVVLVLVSILLSSASAPDATGTARSSMAQLAPLSNDMDDNTASAAAFTAWLRSKTQAVVDRIQAASSSSSPGAPHHLGAAIMPKMGNQTLRAALGRSSWHLIHTMGNTYPNAPQPDEQESMRLFIYLIGRLYPCGDCAEHFQAMLRTHPPEPHLGSRDALSQYLCKLHNKANLRLGHAVFDCNKVGDRWKCGCADEDGAPKPKIAGSTAVVEEEVEEDPEIAALSPLERTLLIERRSLFDEDYAALLARKQKEMTVRDALSRGDAPLAAAGSAAPTTEAKAATVPPAVKAHEKLRVPIPDA